MNEQLKTIASSFAEEYYNLTALEPGVYVHGKLMETGESVRLHHGKTFDIGQTTFTYIEKDR